MDEAPKLTARQQQILDLVQSAMERTGAPTRAEIAAELGFRSANAAEEHLQALARKGLIELVGGTSRGIRLRSDAMRKLAQAHGKQFMLPLPGIAQLSLPLVGRVAAGSPILAQEHIDQTYVVEVTLFTPGTAMSDCSAGSVTVRDISSGARPCASIMMNAIGAVIDGISSCLSALIENRPNSATAAVMRPTTSRFFRLVRVRNVMGPSGHCVRCGLIARGA